MLKPAILDQLSRTREIKSHHWEAQREVWDTISSPIIGQYAIHGFTWWIHRFILGPQVNSTSSHGVRESRCDVRWSHPIRGMPNTTSTRRFFWTATAFSGWERLFVETLGIERPTTQESLYLTDPVWGWRSLLPLPCSDPTDWNFNDVNLRPKTPKVVFFSDDPVSFRGPCILSNNPVM